MLAKTEKKRKVVVLGDEGMLGQMAVAYFRARSCEVVVIPMRYEPETRKEFISAVRDYPGAVVINAIGRIKQKSEAVRDLLWANAVLPLDLARGLSADHVLIHPSTDCVFSGRDGRPSGAQDSPDAVDDYGWSKRLGEVAIKGRPNTLILRVSIIGPDCFGNPKGLLGWFLSQPEGSRLKGYTNHYWNGITTLEWCKQVDGWLAERYGKGDPCRLLQFGTAESYSKYEMLRLFREIYGTGHQIDRYATEIAVDRRLVPDIVCKSLQEQLIELRGWSHV